MNPVFKPIRFEESVLAVPRQGGGLAQQRASQLAGYLEAFERIRAEISALRLQAAGDTRPPGEN
ncbi:MAG: hypothetical protein JNN30_03535 [Rhodanobacteraceae bacterium]|nr:hypothetical protein [Rhodanobacteraceae bacterium]